MDNGSERAGRGGGYGTRLRACLLALAGLVAGLRPELYSGADALRLTELFAWGEKLCATGKALAARRVVDTGAWEPSGERSAADWLARVSGQTYGQAAQALEAARRLADQPEVEAAARAGKLSAAQNTLVTAAAAKAPEKTGELLDRAGTDSLVGLRDRAQEIRLAADDELSERARYRAIHKGRYLRTWADDDGSGRLSGRFTPDALAAIVSALSPFQQEVFDTARRAGTRERRECHAADALVAMARTAAGQTGPPPPAGNGNGGGSQPAGGDASGDTGDTGKSAGGGAGKDTGNSAGGEGSPPAGSDVGGRSENPAGDNPAGDEVDQPAGSDACGPAGDDSAGDHPAGDGGAAGEDDRGGPSGAGGPWGDNGTGTAGATGAEAGPSDGTDRDGTLGRADDATRNDGTGDDSAGDDGTGATLWPDGADSRDPAAPDPDHDGAPDSDDPPGAPGPDSKRPARARPPAVIIVRIDHAALVRGYRQGDECCEIAGIGLVPVATVRAMMADAFLAAVVTDGIDIRSVVHLGRTVTARQETALITRDPQCVVPGCHTRHGLEIDHVQGWSATRITTIDTLARLCHHHHQQKTHHGWQLHGPPGHWQWTGPDNPTPPGGPPPPDNPGGLSDAPPTAASLFDTTQEPFPP